MKTVDVHEHAVEDISLLRKTNVRVAAEVLALLDHIEADPRAIDKLTTRGNNHFGAARIGVKRWESVWRRDGLWRFRMFDTPATGWRVIYGYNSKTRQICVLAVVKKEDFDYDDHESPIAKRILEDWRSI